jgi:hypothetical protein
VIYGSNYKTFRKHQLLYDLIPERIYKSAINFLISLRHKDVREKYNNQKFLATSIEKVFSPHLSHAPHSLSLEYRS